MKWTVHIKHSAHGEVWLLTQGMQRVIGSVAVTSHNFLWTSFTIKWKMERTNDRQTMAILTWVFTRHFIQNL